MSAQYYLATTGISKIWDSDNKLIILGPWCLRNDKNKSIARENGCAFASSPWRPPIALKDAFEYCRELYEAMLPQLARRLNQLHGVSYPEKYWRILIGTWLIHFIQVFYDRFKRIETAISGYPGMYTSVIPAGDCLVSSFDTLDSVNLEEGDDLYNLKLFSLIVQRLFPDIGKEIKPDIPESVKISGSDTRMNWKQKLCDCCLGIFEKYFPGSVLLSHMHGIGYYDKIMLKFRSGFTSMGFIEFSHNDNGYTDNGYSPEQRARIKLDAQAVSDPFENLLGEILPKAIPRCYVENYGLYVEEARKVKIREKITAIGSSLGWYFNEEFKFFAADAAASGTKLIDFQHGGNYGQCLVIPHETESRQRDIFYTWGWTEENRNIRPMPSPHLSLLKDTHSPRSDDILFISTTMPPYVYRLHTQLLPEDMSKYFNDQQIFVRSLSDEARKALLYRPHPYEYGWGENSLIKDSCPQARFADDVNIRKLMQRVKLVVVDHPNTSILEALTINAPSIFYWDHEVYLMRKEAGKYFEALRAAGILYKDPLSAAKKINEIIRDPGAWWNNTAVRRVRSDFCDRFACAGKDWIAVWAKEMKAVARLSS